MQSRITIAVPNQDGTIFAAVTATLHSPGLYTTRCFLNALKRAVTSWVNEDEEGDKVCCATHEAFNLGHLAKQNLSPTGTLHPFLLEEGIEALEVKVYRSRKVEDWHFETVLVNYASPLEQLKEVTKEIEVPQEALDGLVTDAKMEEASSLNNEGPDIQLAYLLDRYGPRGAAKALRAAGRLRSK